MAEPYHGRTTTYATAQRLADRSHLHDVRTAVVGHARAHGFPDGQPRAGFDETMPGLLLDVLEMAPAEAGEAEVWNFLSLVLLPDVALWRWPNESRNPGYERLIGKPRNVLRRHWWRGHLITPRLCPLMNEDELVQITERGATLGGDPRVARTVVETFLEFAERADFDMDGSSRPVARMRLMRGAAKRILRLARGVMLSTVESEELSQMFEELFLATAHQLAESEGVTLTVRPRTASQQPVRPREQATPEQSPTPTQPTGHLEAELDRRLARLCDRAEADLPMDAGPLRRTISDHGALGTAKRLIHQDDIGWRESLLNFGRPDLTIEAVALDPELSELFDGAEIDAARRVMGLDAGSTPDPSPVSTVDDHAWDGSPASDERRLAEVLRTESAEYARVVGHPPTVLLHMLADMGAIETARRIVNAPHVSAGFTELWTAQRLDLSVEAVILRQDFVDLFDDFTIQRARRRLDDHAW